MRNRIAATADRPIPLPDRILSDAWWLLARPRPAEAELRPTVVPKQEGSSERDCSTAR